MDKTNVMRLLDGMGISYTPRSYPADGSVPSGVEAARLMGEDPSHVFKTLVTQGASRRYYVFVIPVAEELSLKKAAAAVVKRHPPCSRARIFCRSPAMYMADVPPSA